MTKTTFTVNLQLRRQLKLKEMKFGKAGGGFSKHNTFSYVKKCEFKNNLFHDNVIVMSQTSLEHSLWEDD